MSTYFLIFTQIVCCMCRDVHLMNVNIASPILKAVIKKTKHTEAGTQAKTLFTTRTFRTRVPVQVLAFCF